MGAMVSGIAIVCQTVAEVIKCSLRWVRVRVRARVRFGLAGKKGGCLNFGNCFDPVWVLENVNSIANLWGVGLGATMYEKCTEHESVPSMT